MVSITQVFVFFTNDRKIRDVINRNKTRLMPFLSDLNLFVFGDVSKFVKCVLKSYNGEFVKLFAQSVEIT